MKVNPNVKELVFNKIESIKKKNKDYLFYIEQILKNDEIYSEISRQISSLNFKIGKLKFNNQDTSLLEKEKHSLENKLEERLVQLKISKIDLSLKYNCVACKDTGIINGKYCSCFLKYYKTLFFTQLGISDKKLFSFKDNKIDNKNPLFPIIEFCKSYAENFIEKKNNLVLFGKCGTGKTFLAECIATELKNKFNVLYLNSFELNNIFTKIHTAPLEDKPFYYSAILDCDLIIIDDLGTEPIYNKVTKEYLYLLLNERAKKNKPFIITTNLLPKEILVKYEERIFTRIITSNTTTKTLPDQNLRK